MLEWHLIWQGLDSVLELVHEINLNSVRITLDSQHRLLELAHSVGPREAVVAPAWLSPVPLVEPPGKTPAWVCRPGYYSAHIFKHVTLEDARRYLQGQRLQRTKDSHCLQDLCSVKWREKFTSTIWTPCLSHLKLELSRWRVCPGWHALNFCLRLWHLRVKVLFFITSMCSELPELQHRGRSYSTSMECLLITDYQLIGYQDTLP